jgi:GntR family transcriptional repressor for pyruvate dehydrogenase complex
MKRDPESKRKTESKHKPETKLKPMTIRRADKKHVGATKRSLGAPRNVPLKQRTGNKRSADANGSTRATLKRLDETIIPAKVTTEACMPDVADIEMADHVPATQVGELALKIRQRIQTERLTDGSFFMTEAQLAAQYNASRTVTREAVSRLQALGILEGRKRKGLIVRCPDPLVLFQNSLPSLATSPDDWRDVAQLRYALEVGAIELAIRSATEEQIERLAEIERDLERSVRDDIASLLAIELDVKFHSLILEMTGSRMIAGMQQVLVQFFHSTPKSDATPASAERICWEHRELLDAIRDRDVERARAMIRIQIRGTLDAAERDASRCVKADPKLATRRSGI